jgi:DNA polymerase III subunit epsilon
VAREIEARLDGAIVVGHNVAFDWAFVTSALERTGRRPSVEPLRLCTLELSRTLDPERTASHRLVDVCERHGVTLDHAHDALADARATAQLLPRLLAASGASTLAQLGAPALAGPTARP